MMMMMIGQQFDRMYVLYESPSMVGSTNGYDIVLVNGLWGRCDTTWREMKSKELWPRDWLPSSLFAKLGGIEVTIRVLSVEYEFELPDVLPPHSSSSSSSSSGRRATQKDNITAVEEKQIGSTFDFSTPALQMVQSLLQAHVGHHRPIMFITHGAGGLIVKEALLLCKTQSDTKYVTTFIHV